VHVCVCDAFNHVACWPLCLDLQIVQAEFPHVDASAFSIGQLNGSGDLEPD
jgi:hypothetical protein